MMINKPVKGIFLDIGWTMNYPRSGSWMITQKFYDMVDIGVFKSIEKSRYDNAYAIAMKYLEDNHFVYNENQEFEQFKIFYGLIAKMLPELGLSDKSAEIIAYDKVMNDDNFIFYDDVADTLDRLSGEYKLGIISDTWPSAERILKNAGIMKYFDAHTFSCYLGVYKPHPKMYKDALRSLGVSPKKTIFIDDVPICLDGAKKFGIQPLLITRKNKPDTLNNYPGIFSLAELLDII